MVHIQFAQGISNDNPSGSGRHSDNKQYRCFEHTNMPVLPGQKTSLPSPNYQQAKEQHRNQTLINNKCVCGALNRHFYQTRVSGSLFSVSLKSVLF